MSIVRRHHMRTGVLVALVFVACSGTGEPAAPNAPAKIVEVDTGNFHTCVRLDDGSVECWGQCIRQCGVRPDGVTERLQVVGLGNPVELAVADAHACARLADGDVACWGSNYGNLLGRLEPDQSSMPLLVPDVHDAVEIAIGGDRTCARLEDGGITCWGASAGDYDQSHEAALARLPKRVEARTLAEVFPSAAGGCTCNLGTDGAVKCIASGIMTARLADGSSPPVQLHHCPSDGLTGVRELGDRCAIMNDSTLRCWGEMFFARDGGDAKYEDLREPLAMDGMTDVVALAEGSSHTCVMKGSGEVLCWGGNGQGQIDGTPSDKSVWPPRRVEAVPAPR